MDTKLIFLLTLLAFISFLFLYTFIKRKIAKNKRAAIEQKRWYLSNWNKYLK